MIQIGKEEVKLQLLAFDIILYLKDSTKKKKEKEQNTLQSHKHFEQDTKSTFKKVAFLYTNSRKTEKEIKKTILFTIASKHKIPKNKLEVNHLQNENYKTLNKEIKEILEHGKTSHVHVSVE
jgi:hypothetical protein